MMPRKNFPPRAARGLTLIEMMVAIAIGLFIVLAVVNVMVTQEGIRRNATSGSDAMANAAVGMLVLERSIKNGGYGMSSGVPGGLMDTCTPQGVQVENSTRSSTSFSFAPFEFAPVVINPSSIPAGDTNTQVIRVTYTGNQIVGSSVIYASAVTPAVRLQSRAGLNSGDLVVLGQPTVGCGMRQITALPNNLRCSTAADAALSDAVQFGTANYKSDYDASCGDRAPKFNGDGTLPFTFTPTTSSAPGLRLYTLGDADRFKSVIFAVRNHQLTMCDFMAQACEDAAKVNDATVWQPIVDDVVSVLAQYGIDTTGDGVVDSWTATTPTTLAGGWNGAVAVRVAVTTRAKAYNKDEVVIDAGAGKNSPAWIVGDIVLTHVPDWKHYRYNVAETTIPLKNVIWKD